ncbi:hypothetical protein PHMEG_00011393 [Phytophthora megakarya]|uniref:Uncharacterized protein n=1 Tax=Phytophthora megakarya TaxID=4795 RepID=A0A225WBB7_9STRA|nr:hypothetical protein PHMEG_00011393 [Phytophthora megakarya]
MKKVVADTVDKASGVTLHFKASMVSGTCTKTAYGPGNQEVTGDDLNRVAAFPSLGDVYPLDAVASSADTLTAVISFATDETSYNEIVTFESLNQLVNVVNFQLSGSADNCEGGPDSCIELKEDNDIFMYNPFTVTQSLDCADLENGVPVTLKGDDGTRQCYCGCPAGYEMQTKGRDKVCVKVGGDAASCVWSKVNGYKHQVTAQNGVCSFDHVVDKWGIPLPLPTSGYGAKKMLLLADASLDPRISVSAVKIQKPEYYAGYLSPILAELTMENIAKANDLVQQYFEYGDQAENDGCSGNNRCDLQQFTRKNFFENKYTRYSHDDSISCFDQDAVLGDVLNHRKITINPLKHTNGSCYDEINPVPTGQCTRCCKMSTSLREFWTDYRCGSDYDARYCEGDLGQSCPFEQCLVINGDTFATATAKIKANVIADSKQVLQQLHEEDYQTVTQIHRALECTSYYGDDGVCEYMAKLSELIDTTHTLKLGGDYNNADDFVHWRFKVNGDAEKWHLWKTRRQTSAETGCSEPTCEDVYDDDPVLTFSDPETKISIEAWTQCGIVRKFFFFMHLHVNSAVDVCKHFDEMWYQASVSRLPVDGQMCAFPGSDFAELTFDFHPNVGLQNSRTELRMKVTEVVCFGSLENRTPVNLLKVTRSSPEIVKRFGVELVHTPNTEALTNFDITCDFRYVGYGESLHTKTCGRSFSIADCKGPQFDVPGAKCEFDACAGKAKAGLFEACGGNIIRSTATSTYMESGEKECCQGCDNTDIICVPLLDVPTADAELMRCEPASGYGGYGAYSYGNYYFPMSLLAEATQNHPVAMMTLSASMLAIAAGLIAFQRRKTALSSAQFSSDAYYPLMD